MDELNLTALAKINLGLDVLRRREDGYHEVRMVMQTIHLSDQIRIVKSREPGIRIKTNLYYLPANEKNLAYKAARLLQEEFALEEGVEIDIKKRIPVAAGMAGGSADAAAVLFGMNRMFGLRLSVEGLMERGLTLGADVPYCVMRKTALAEGIGEKLTPLSPAPKCMVLVAKPPISISTKFVYDHLVLDEETPHPDIDALVAAIEAEDLHGLAAHMGNVLETVTCRQYPVIERLKEAMRSQGALNAMMSGSGPAVFGLFDDIKAARAAMAAIRSEHLAKQLYLTNLHHSRR